MQFDPEVWQIVWVSLKVSIIAVILSSICAVPLGLFIGVNHFFAKHFIQQVLNTLMAIPTVVIGLCLYGLLSRKGLLGEFDMLYSSWAIVLGECLLITPIILNLTIVAVHSTDNRLVSTLVALGANQWQMLKWVFSEARLAVMSAVVTGFGRAIGEVGIAILLGGNIAGVTRTMTTAIALETSKGEFEFALALGILLLGIAFLVNIILHYLHREIP